MGLQRVRHINAEHSTASPYQPQLAIQLPSRQRWSSREAWIDPLWEEMRVSRQQTDLMIMWVPECSSHRISSVGKCPLSLCVVFRPLLFCLALQAQFLPGWGHSPVLICCFLSWGFTERMGMGLIGIWGGRKEERIQPLQENSKASRCWRKCSECEQVRIPEQTRRCGYKRTDLCPFTDLGKYDE